MKKYLTLTIVLIVKGMIVYHAAAQPVDTLRVLFVGNSYTFTNNLPQIVSLISDSTHTKLVTRQSTVGGAKLSEHWNSARGLRTRELIAGGHFDVVVLQEHSLGTILEPDSMLLYSRKLCELCQKSAATPCFYMTWAREKVPQYQEQITRLYKQAAKDNRARVAPVGLVWALAMKYRPGIGLFSPDGSHPAPLGTFLTACVFVHTLTGELPSNIRKSFSVKDSEGEPVQLMYLDELDIEFCRRVTLECLSE